MRRVQRCLKVVFPWREMATAGMMHGFILGYRNFVPGGVWWLSLHEIWCQAAVVYKDQFSIVYVKCGGFSFCCCFVFVFAVLRVSTFVWWQKTCWELVLCLGRRFVKEHFLGWFAVLRLLNLCFSFAGCSSRDDLCCPELNSGIARVSRLLQFSAPGDLGSNN
jgi:hypothetical protein